MWVLPPVVAASWAASITSRLRVVNFSAPNWLNSAPPGWHESWGPLWSHSASTRQKLSRFPSSSGSLPERSKTLPANCLILGTAGHSCCMPPFTMPKYLADNRIVAAVFIALVFVNAFAIQNSWY